MVALGTAGLNAYFGRSFGENLLRNAEYAAGSALLTSGVVIGAGLLVQGGVVQQGLYSVGNAATRWCVTHPVGCSRVGAGLTLWDTFEDWGLRAKLAIQTAHGDPRAADTALELQLEQLDNAPGNTTFREVQETLSTLVGRYGDDVARLVGRFGVEGTELLTKYQDEGVDFLSRHVDGAEEVAGYVQNVVDIDLAKLDLEQGYQVSKLSSDVDVPIVITGRLADTQAEKEVREKAAQMMEGLVAQGIDENAAIIQVAQAFGINPHQVKKSTGGPEVDVFISKDIWDTFSTEKKNALREELIRIFNVNNHPDFEVDFYQDIEKRIPGWPDPSTNIPPGSIIFNPDGTIIHDTISR